MPAARWRLPRTCRPRRWRPRPAVPAASCAAAGGRPGPAGAQPAPPLQAAAPAARPAAAPGHGPWPAGGRARRLGRLQPRRRARGCGAKSCGSSRVHADCAERAGRACEGCRIPVVWQPRCAHLAARPLAALDGQPSAAVGHRLRASQLACEGWQAAKRKACNELAHRQDFGPVNAAAPDAPGWKGLQLCALLALPRQATTWPVPQPRDSPVSSPRTMVPKGAPCSSNTACTSCSSSSTAPHDPQDVMPCTRSKSAESSAPHLGQGEASMIGRRRRRQRQRAEGSRISRWKAAVCAASR